MSIPLSEKAKRNRLFHRILYFPVTRIIVGMALCFAVLVGVQNFITKPTLYTILTSKNIADAIINYASMLVLLLSYFYLFRLYEKRKVTELLPKNLAKELSAGFILGFFALSLVIVILYFGGYYKANGVNNLSYLLAPFSFLVIAALLEEVFFRLIVYRILEEWIGTYLALVLISVIFTVPHLFNNHISWLSVVMLLLFSIVHGLMYTYTKRLWLPFAFHLGWNFAQPFYGSHLSGIENIGSVLRSTFEGPALLIGSEFGIEDSILSIILLGALSIIFLKRSIGERKIVERKRNEA